MQQLQHPSVAIGCGLLHGVDAVPVLVEATLGQAGDGTPRILGLCDASVREGYHRVLHAFRALGLPSPRGITTINLTPASLRKTGSGFDLPLALALAGASGLLPPERTRALCAFGEVSLGGALLPARGAVAVALAAKARGWTELLTSHVDAARCALVPGLRVHGANDLSEALLFLRGQCVLPPAVPAVANAPAAAADLLDLRGHRTPKLALAVCAAGRHNLLLAGPPGAGKSALLRRLPGLLPPLLAEERLDVLRIHTAAGTELPPDGQRPFRAPHHTSSAASLLGGGADVRPGEATLAHHGVLFLDELPEFRRDALEGLRQPLEDAVVTVGRARAAFRMPADFLLVAAMNPCPCGWRGHPSRPCRCPPPLVQRYQARVSGPLLDRIDLRVEVPALPPDAFRGEADPGGSTAALRDRVMAAIARQEARNRVGNGRWVANGRLPDRWLGPRCGLGAAAQRTVDEAMRLQGLSARARARLLRVARTVADLDQREEVNEADVLEACALRGFAER